MDPMKIIRPHSERDVRLFRLFAIGIFPFGMAFLCFGVPSVSIIGWESLWLIIPGIVLCAGSFVIYRRWNGTREIFERSIGIAEAKVIERKRKSVRSDPFGSGGGSGEGAIIEIGIYLFVRILEGLGLREPKYRYVGHKLILEFQATQIGVGETQVMLEVNVTQADYNSSPPGSVIKIRYATEKPNIALFEKEYISRFEAA